MPEYSKLEQLLLKYSKLEQLLHILAQREHPF